jgi:hypothetical protein
VKTALRRSTRAAVRKAVAAAEDMALELASEGIALAVAYARAGGPGDAYELASLYVGVLRAAAEDIPGRLEALNGEAFATGGPAREARKQAIDAMAGYAHALTALAKAIVAVEADASGATPRPNGPA